MVIVIVLCLLHSLHAASPDHFATPEDFNSFQRQVKKFQAKDKATLEFEEITKKIRSAPHKTLLNAPDSWLTVHVRHIHEKFYIEGAGFFEPELMKGIVNQSKHIRQNPAEFYGVIPQKDDSTAGEI